MNHVLERESKLSLQNKFSSFFFQKFNIQCHKNCSNYNNKQKKISTNCAKNPLKTRILTQHILTPQNKSVNKFVSTYSFALNKTKFLFFFSKTSRHGQLLQSLKELQTTN